MATACATEGHGGVDLLLDRLEEAALPDQEVAAHGLHRLKLVRARARAAECGQVAVLTDAPRAARGLCSQAPHLQVAEARARRWGRGAGRGGRVQRVGEGLERAGGEEASLTARHHRQEHRAATSVAGRRVATMRAASVAAALSTDTGSPLCG